MQQLPTLPTSLDLQESIASIFLPQITGQVAEVAGPMIRASGMTAPIGAICRITPRHRPPLLVKVVGFFQDAPVLAPLESAEGISAGDPVEVLDVSLRIPIGIELCGRVIDALGKPLDSQPLPAGLRSVPLDSNPPTALDRPTIRKMLPTGIRAIDGMLTCGAGQRMGIFAGSGVGKSTLLSMLTRGTKTDVVVIGLVGERGREVREFLDVALGPEGLRRSVVVVATSDQPATLRIQAAWTATAIAEQFRDQGKNVLLMIDSVTRLALAQREIGLAAGEPPTTRGYPPSVFDQLPRLVERAGRTEKGAITAFYSVLVEGDDMNDPIADCLRGLLDGHIVLSRKLAEAGHYPAIDILSSLSRLQPHVAPPAIAAAAQVVRSRLAEYRRHEDLLSVGAYRAGSNLLLDAAIATRDATRAFLTQPTSQAIPHETTFTALKQLVGGSEASAGVAASAAPAKPTPPPKAAPAAKPGAR